MPARASAAFKLQIFKLQDKPEVQQLSMYLGMYCTGKKITNNLNPIEIQQGKVRLRLRS